jgi:predicted DNA binding CopG/RHH family protein
MRQVSKRKNKDTQLEEFETKDLGHDIAQSKAAVVVRPKTRQMPTSIFLDPAIIKKLRTKAEKRGIGYQTMLKIIIHEHVDEY